MSKVVGAYLAKLDAADAEAPHVLRTRAESARRAWRLRAEIVDSIEFAGGMFQFMHTLATMAPVRYVKRVSEPPKEVVRASRHCVYL
jgi:hypothetical protein